MSTIIVAFVCGYVLAIATCALVYLYISTYKARSNTTHETVNVKQTTPPQAPASQSRVVSPRQRDALSLGDLS